MAKKKSKVKNSLVKSKSKLANADTKQKMKMSSNKKRKTTDDLSRLLFQ